MYIKGCENTKNTKETEIKENGWHERIFGVQNNVRGTYYWDDKRKMFVKGKPFSSKKLPFGVKIRDKEMDVPVERYRKDLTIDKWTTKAYRNR